MDKTNLKKANTSSWKHNLLLIVFSLIFALLVLEIAIRTYDMVKGYGFFSGRRNLLSRNMAPASPFRIFGFELYKNENGVKYISSRYGELYPVKKPSGTFRIVVFGGSTTENGHSFNTAGIHYPILLQSKLRESLGTGAIEVINVAKGAYATPHSLILFELDVLSWQPDMIIVSHNINDLHAVYWPNFTYDYSNKYSHKFFLPDYKSNFQTSGNLVLGVLINMT
ncbi:MAG: SGNH/GDSL hydrolase family protein [Candidatus Auribacterota bacterium]|nr:SGNH/GDSL hydrolase family protein [Candidatus Auribacterota bacterium]